MKSIFVWLIASLGILALADLAQAGGPCCPYCPFPQCNTCGCNPMGVYNPYRPSAPDACNPGFYATNHCGAVYGPNYNLRPPFPPYNGERPCLKPQFGTHLYARSPRDFFMVD